MNVTEAPLASLFVAKKISSGAAPCRGAGLNTAFDPSLATSTFVRRIRVCMGMKLSTSSAPMLAIGGSESSRSKEPKSASWPESNRCSVSTDSSTCSLLLAGSGSRPSKRNKSDTAALSLTIDRFARERGLATAR